MAKNKIRVQCLIFSKGSFSTRWKVRDWIRKNDYKIDKRLKYPIFDDRNGCFRVIQRNSDYFKKKTFKERKLGRGIKGVFGYYNMSFDEDNNLIINPESCQDFANRKIKEFIRDNIKAYRYHIAEENAKESIDSLEYPIIN